MRGARITCAHRAETVTAARSPSTSTIAAATLIPRDPCPVQASPAPNPTGRSQATSADLEIPRAGPAPSETLPCDAALTTAAHGMCAAWKTRWRATPPNRAAAFAIVAISEQIGTLI